MIGTDSHTPNAGGLRHVRLRRRRRRRRGRDGRLPVGGEVPEADRRPPDRAPARVDRSQGRHPQARRHPHGQGRRPTPSSSTSGPGADVHLVHRQGARSPTWAPSSARRPRSSPSTTRWTATCARTDRGALADLAASPPRTSCTADPEVERDPERVLLARDRDRPRRTLEPHLVGPHTPDLARPVLRGRAGGRRARAIRTQIAVALIGSCTNSSYEDIARVADVVRQAKRARRRARDGAVHGDAGLRAGPRDDRARRADGRARSRSAPGAGQRLRAVHRPVAARRDQARARGTRS